MDYIGTKEASKRLNVSCNTISRWCREGKIEGAEQDAPGSPWRIPTDCINSNMIKKRKTK